MTRHRIEIEFDSNVLRAQYLLRRFQDDMNDRGERGYVTNVEVSMTPVTATT